MINPKNLPVFTLHPLFDKLRRGTGRFFSFHPDKFGTGVKRRKIRF
jgi:hypothetical protein